MEYDSSRNNKLDYHRQSSSGLAVTFPIQIFVAFIQFSLSKLFEFAALRTKHIEPKECCNVAFWTLDGSIRTAARFPPCGPSGVIDNDPQRPAPNVRVAEVI